MYKNSVKKSINFSAENLHLYHYAGNNPVKYVDPDGNSAFVAIAVTAWSVNVLLLVTELVIASGPTQEEHYNRNINQKNQIYYRVEDAIAAGYTQLGIKEGIENAERLDNYHEMGKLPDGYPNPSGNDKYVKLDPKNPGSSFELVFDKNGNLVIDSVNQGTYNFSDPKGIKGKINHFIKDMVPYYIWGNSKLDKDTTTFKNRLLGDFKGNIPDPTLKE